jgi:hypothetical protein
MKVSKMAGDDISKAPKSTFRKEARLTPVAAAALFGSTMVAAAGAYFGTRALARRNRAENGRPINSVMAAAITACDLAHDKPSTDQPGTDKGVGANKDDKAAAG